MINLGMPKVPILDVDMTKPNPVRYPNDPHNIHINSNHDPHHRPTHGHGNHSPLMNPSPDSPSSHGLSSLSRPGPSHRRNLSRD